MMGSENPSPIIMQPHHLMLDRGSNACATQGCAPLNKIDQMPLFHATFDNDHCPHQTGVGQSLKLIIYRKCMRFTPHYATSPQPVIMVRPLHVIKQQQTDTHCTWWTLATSISYPREEAELRKYQYALGPERRGIVYAIRPE